MDLQFQSPHFYKSRNNNNNFKTVIEQLELAIAPK